MDEGEREKGREGVKDRRGRKGGREGGRERGERRDIVREYLFHVFNYEGERGRDEEERVGRRHRQNHVWRGIEREEGGREERERGAEVGS